MNNDLFPTQPTLFATEETHRRKLDVWKERHGITTVHYPQPPDSISGQPEYPWYAGARGRNRRRDTEEEACFALAQAHELPWLEQEAKR